MNQAKFEVYIGANHVDTVFFDADTSAREVRRAMVNHDGLPNTISVYKRHPTKPAFTDVARASHPEELA